MHQREFGKVDQPKTAGIVTRARTAKKKERFPCIKLLHAR